MRAAQDHNSEFHTFLGLREAQNSSIRCNEEIARWTGGPGCRNLKPPSLRRAESQGEALWGPKASWYPSPRSQTHFFFPTHFLIGLRSLSVGTLSIQVRFQLQKSLCGPSKGSREFSPLQKARICGQDGSSDVWIQRQKTVCSPSPPHTPFSPLPQFLCGGPWRKNPRRWPLGRKEVTKSARGEGRESWNEDGSSYSCNGPRTSFHVPWDTTCVWSYSPSAAVTWGTPTPQSGKSIYLL